RPSHFCRIKPYHYALWTIRLRPLKPYYLTIVRLTPYANSEIQAFRLLVTRCFDARVRKEPFLQEPPPLGLALFFWLTDQCSISLRNGGSASRRSWPYRRATIRRSSMVTRPVSCSVRSKRPTA